MELSGSTSNAGQIGYWTQVVLKGLSDQSQLLERSKHRIERMKPDEFVAHRDRAWEKIGRAIKEVSPHPLRELTTNEKGVVAKDIRNTGSALLNLAHTR